MTSLLGLLLVLLGLFIASLCVSVQKMSVNVSDGCASSHQSPPRPLPPALLPFFRSLKATHQTLRWRSARTETWTVTSSSSCGTPPPRTRSPGDDNNTIRAHTSAPLAAALTQEEERRGRTDRERDRFLWCFLDFLECFFVFEWWCWHSCCGGARKNMECDATALNQRD